MDHVIIVPLPPGPHPKGDSAWHLSGGIESEITTLAAWCQVERQQRKPLEIAKGEEKEDWSDEEQLSDGDDDDLTNLPASLTEDNAKSIKMIFLDRLAEILCT
jgi:hypothetical protein